MRDSSLRFVSFRVFHESFVAHIGSLYICKYAYKWTIQLLLFSKMRENWDCIGSPFMWRFVEFRDSWKFLILYAT